MKAKLLYEDRRDFEDGAIVEMVIWLVPQPIAGSAHRFKYRLYYGYPGDRVVGYDNERPKGDHRHVGDREETYVFVSPEQLLADFWRDVLSVRKEKGK